MKMLIRAAVAGIAGVAAMALSGPAFGAINPRLTIGTAPGSSKVTIESHVAPTDDSIARMQVYVPTGYGLKAPVGGSQVGTVTATAHWTQRDPNQPAPVKRTGTVKAIAPTDPAIAWETANCAPGAHQAAWLVQVLGGDDSWSFPIFVDATAGSETQFGPLKLTACFKPTSLEPNGNKFISMSLALDGFTTPKAAGTYRWRSLWTPFNAGATTMNTAASVEAQSVARIQSAVLTISSKRVGSSDRFALSGKLLVDGEAFGGARIALVHGATKAKLTSMGRVTTTKAGTFAAKIRVKAVQYVQAGTTIGGGTLGTGGCTASFGVPCVSASDARVVVLSRLIAIRR
jgi:hypothetical protein